MKKDFDKWNKIKQKTHEEEKTRLYTVREVWWCRLGVNIGTEQDGKGNWHVRPCVIVCAFGPDACFIVPLTTSKKKHFLRVSVGEVNGISARANISQMRVVDTRRLQNKIAFINNDTFCKLKKRIRELF